MDPENFLSQPAAISQGRKTLDFDKSPSVLLVFAANRFTRSNARFYQQKFGIGVMEWRLLVMLTREPNIPVARMAKVIGIDKAAISRSLGRLEQTALATATQPKGDARRRTWCLTSKGRELHDQVLQHALNRQSQLLKGFSNPEVLQLNDLLKRLLNNIGHLA